MLFKCSKFRDKKSVRKETKEELRAIIEKNIPEYSKCNEGFILQYIDLLLDETPYNLRTGTFYYHYNWVKIDLSMKLLGLVASEYINEHLSDFLLEKYK